MVVLELLKYPNITYLEIGCHSSWYNNHLQMLVHS